MPRRPKPGTRRREPYPSPRSGEGSARTALSALARPGLIEIGKAAVCRLVLARGREQGFERGVEIALPGAEIARELEHVMRRALGALDRVLDLAQRVGDRRGVRGRRARTARDARGRDRLLVH